MADVANKYPENVAGTFYVDDQCIDCDLCRETAPASFKRNDDGGHTYVYKVANRVRRDCMAAHADRDTSPLFEIARVVVRLDHVARIARSREFLVAEIQNATNYLLVLCFLKLPSGSRDKSLLQHIPESVNAMATRL